MDKLTMAHEFMMKKMETETIDNHWELFYSSWRYADAMQAEADKRNNKETCDKNIGLDSSVLKPSNSGELEWQPDWSQAPNDAKYWAMDKDSSANFFRNKPEITNGNGWDFGGVMQSNNAHKYNGNWTNSLRKRPQ